MHCGPLNQNFGWAMAHPAHAAAPPHDVVSRSKVKRLKVRSPDIYIPPLTAKPEQHAVVYNAKCRTDQR